MRAQACHGSPQTVLAWFPGAHLLLTATSQLLKVTGTNQNLSLAYWRRCEQGKGWLWGFTGLSSVEGAHFLGLSFCLSARGFAVPWKSPEGLDLVLALTAKLVDHLLSDFIISCSSSSSLTRFLIVRVKHTERTHTMMHAVAPCPCSCVRVLTTCVYMCTRIYILSQTSL